MKRKISRALISVSDKTNLNELAKYLSSEGIEIISTGGTKKFLQKNKIPAIDISEFTGFEEILNGRVKTLHPSVHGGLLAIIDDLFHVEQLQKNNIKPIDLLIVNLYPFTKTAENSHNENEIIENIDIGGPAMIRSAAKNFSSKTVITDISDYEKLIAEMRKYSGETSLKFRQNMASRAFKLITDYDAAISNWFLHKTMGEAPEATKSMPNDTIKQELEPSQNRLITFEAKGKYCDGLALRYGENAHQKAYLYSNSASGIVNATQIQGKELSYNNLNDANCGYQISTEFSSPSCTIIKHANPCGAALDTNLLTAYKKALASDSKSAFGGIVSMNGKIDEPLAKELVKTFYEVIIAKEIDEGAKQILSTKSNLRILLTDFKKTSTDEAKSISGGFLIQEKDDKIFHKKDLIKAGKFSAKEGELDQLVFAMQICKNTKSNAIVIVSDFQVIGIGAGQTSRVDACEIACKKAKNFLQEQIVPRGTISYESSANLDFTAREPRAQYLASDAFFPFPDSIKVASEFGISAIIAPKGSIKDGEIISMANEKSIPLYFISTRHFKH
jgi:phosphoribosylaminoimidazolecarboxamide formyltransferase/IMP cyclohydrolase